MKVDAHLTSVKVESLSKGIELSSFEVSASGFMAAVAKAERVQRPEILDEIISGWYTSLPPILPSDILRKKITSSEEGGRVKISLHIRRGVLELAKLCAEHRSLLFIRGEEEIGIMCSCHPGEVFLLSKNSLPPSIWERQGEKQVA